MKAIRNLGVYLLLISVLMSTAGVSVYKHYCGDFLASLSIYAPTDDCSDMEDDNCEAAGMDCCDTETEYYTAELDLFKHEIKLIDFDQFIAEPLFTQLSAQQTTEVPSYYSSEKKLSGGPPLYILNSSLTYYG